MSYYKKHIFFCLNQRDAGKQCCNNAGASVMRDYCKERAYELGLAGPGGVRVNMAGCLGRCAVGPNIVVYPDAVWYTYACKADIDEILQEHIMCGRIVTRLLTQETPS